MNNFKQWLEVFGNFLPYEWVEKSAYQWVAFFDLPDGRQFKINILRNRNECTIDFNQEKPFVSIGITGLGSASTVLSTVIAAVKEFIQKTNPQVIHFKGRGNSKIELYQQIVSSLATGYDVEDNMGSFTLVKRR